MQITNRKYRSNHQTLMVLGLCCLLTACGTNKPSTQDLIDALQSSLPGYIKIEGVSIDATEDVGGEVDAKVRMRFKGKASLIEPLYVSSGGNIHVSGGSMRVLEESAPSGQHLEFYGIAQATYKLDQWQIDFEEREFTPTLRGRPLPFYTPAESYVVKGSKEETALLAKKEQEDAVRLKEQKEQANNLIQMFKDNNLLEGVVRRIPHGDMPFELRISSFGGLDSAKVFEGTLVWKESREDMNKTAAVYCVYEDGHVYIVEPNTAAAGEPPQEFVYGLTSFDNGVIRGSWMLNPPTKSQALYQPGRLIFIRAPR